MKRLVAPQQPLEVHHWEQLTATVAAAAATDLRSRSNQHMQQHRAAAAAAAAQVLCQLLASHVVMLQAMAVGIQTTMTCQH